jgi:soluble lytic murein transglycosylase
MTARLASSLRRPLKSLTIRVVAAIAAGCLCLLAANPTLAAGKAKVKIAKPAAIAAGTVPLPRPDPNRDAASTANADAAPGTNDTTDDAIGALIGNDGRSEAHATEDSDAPEASTPDSTPDQATEPANPPPAKGSGSKPVNAAGLKLAVQLLENNDAAGAALAAYALPDRIDIKIVDWLIATGTYPGVTSTSLIGLRQKLADWPAQSLMKLRYEQAVAREKPAPADAIRALGDRKPASDDATLLLARSYVAVGRSDDAAKLIRAFWRDGDFSEGIETAIVRDFSGLLRSADSKTRMDRQLYDENVTAALRTAKLLDGNQRALAKAVGDVIRGTSKAGKELDALPAAMKRDALYTFARVHLLRVTGKIEAAANVLAAAPRDPKVIVDPDAWWIERRLISRQLIDAGNPKLAYQLAAGHANESATLRAEAEFHAGWYALEYLRDPGTASRHFANIAAISTMPLSLSRAEYWLGRASAAAGNKQGATDHFQRAAAYPTTFYGQLAMAQLGGTRLTLSRPPDASPDLRRSFADRELVQAIRHLEAVGYGDRAATIYRSLAETLTNPAEIALLAGLAEQNGEHQLALQIGKTAASRGMAVDSLAFPTAAIPAGAKTPSVEKPMVYAIARQESAFNPQAVSRAGARGLLQLMPATAKQVAKSIGVTYSKDRLTSDPAYNATLGAAHLGDLVDDFGGSYVMTFAAYNAGASRVAAWVKAHGDPRDPRVDVVNWIERIPFTETRNYVQRIMENLQVYRAQLGQPALKIAADLHRGGATD